MGEQAGGATLQARPWQGSGNDAELQDHARSKQQTSAALERAIQAGSPPHEVIGDGFGVVINDDVLLKLSAMIVCDAPAEQCPRHRFAHHHSGGDLGLEQPHGYAGEPDRLRQAAQPEHT